MKKIFLLLFLLCLSLLSAQMKEWQSVSCEFPSDIDWEEIIWGMETGDSRYIFGFSCESQDRPLWQFEANGNNATCTKTDKDLSIYYPDDNLYLENDTTVYGQNNTSNDLKKFNFQNHNTTMYGGDALAIKSENCQFFLMESKHYCLHYDNKKLYRFTLNDTKASMTYKELPLDNAPINVSKYSANVVVLNNKCYYLSEAGFCEVTVSGDSTASKLILKIDADAIDNTIKNSTLVTDKKNRVWIINDTNGVQEYNSKTGEIQQIAEAPQIENRVDCHQVCFHLNDHLYYIKNGKALCLGVPSPDDPDDPTNPHDQSGHTCGLLGFEFFTVLLGISIIHIYRHK